VDSRDLSNMFSAKSWLPLQCAIMMTKACDTNTLHQCQPHQAVPWNPYVDASGCMKARGSVMCDTFSMCVCQPGFCLSEPRTHVWWTGPWNKIPHPLFNFRVCERASLQTSAFIALGGNASSVASTLEVTTPRLRPASTWALASSTLAPPAETGQNARNTGSEQP